MAKIIWKTQEEIEAEENAPKVLTTEERVSITEQALNDIMMMMF